MSDRRPRPGTLFVVVLLVAAGTATGATVASPGEAASWAPAADATAAPTAPQQDRPVVRQVGIVSRNDEPGSISLTFEYRIPPSVEGLRVGVPVASISGVTVESMDGFERTETTRFLWDTGTARPTVTFRLAVTDSLSGGVRGVERGDWALASEPNTRVQVRADQRPVRIDTFEVASDEPGYARSHLAYLGPHERRNVTVADERATYVLGAENVDIERSAAFLRTANRHFDFGIHHDTVTVFVLPLGEEDTEGVEAATVDTAFWVGETDLQFERTGSVFAHEYVHTRLGTVGTGSAAWLTEATAEYYGRLFAFNDGVGTYDAFLDGLRATNYTADRRSVTLAEPDTWRGTTAHYAKGAHVLAALDAEIQRRTGGERTLRDVFEGRTEPFPNYRAFRLAVVQVAGDDIGPWLDRYVLGDALPPLPEEPRYYVAAPSLDPDGDGMASGAELDAGRHPFVAGPGPDRSTPTATPTATESPTPSPTTTPTGTDATATTREGTAGDAPGFGAVAGLLAVILVGLWLREEG
ncbi:MAG: hypothetical protein ABEI80_03660 [Haloplanus sp.]